MTKLEKIIEGYINDFLSNWKSGYKINEDLPAIAEIMTDGILKTLEDFDYIIINEKILEKVL